MKKHNKLTAIFLAILAMALFATACQDTEKIEGSNKLVDSANKKSDEAKALIIKTSESFDKVLKDPADFDEQKTKHEGELKEIVKNYDKIVELQKSTAKDFVEAAKLSPNDKFKAYYDAKAKHFEKLAEMTNQSKQSAQALLESSDVESYSKKMQEIDTKTTALTKEADEIDVKVKKLEQEVNDLNK